VDVLTDLYSRLGRVFEIPVAAALHPDLHLVARILAHHMLDAVARKSTSNRSRNCGQNTAAPSADLTSQPPASDNFASIRVSAAGLGARCRPC
jgi:hypothetical protein